MEEQQDIVLNDVFSALADSTRRKIVEILSEEGAQPAAKLCEPFEMSAPAVSQHLKVLKSAGVVAVEKRAQQRIYYLNPKALRMIQNWSEMKVASVPFPPEQAEFMLKSRQDLRTKMPRRTAPSDQGALGNLLRMRAKQSHSTR